MNTYRIPKRFYDDHIARDLAGGKIIEETTSHYIVSLDDDEYSELLSDADFYSDSGYVISQMGREYLGLALSAKATAKALRKEIN